MLIIRNNDVLPCLPVFLAHALFHYSTHLAFRLTILYRYMKSAYSGR